MHKTVLTILLALAGAPISPCRAATWYVDASVPQSGDGTSWATAFKTIQQGIDAGSDGETVIVAQGVYAAIHLKGKNVRLVSTDTRDGAVVAGTIIDGENHRVPVTFQGTEGPSCTLSGFTIRNGASAAFPAHPPGDPTDSGTLPIVLYAGGGIRGYGTRATIENNIVTNNWHYERGGGIGECHGLVQGNLVQYNAAGSSQAFGFRGQGGALYQCDGTIRNNTIVHNLVTGTMDYLPGEGFVWVDGEGGALFDCGGTVENCIIWGNSDPQVYASHAPLYSLVGLNAGFVDEKNSDFRLRPASACIDGGVNDPDLPEKDLAGMPRIMFGGKSFTVDIGAYEFFYTGVHKGPGADEATLVWSFVPDKTYSIFYTDDLFNWHLAIEDFPSFGNTTTSWLDDGSVTGLPPLLAPRRFYRLLENP